MLIRFSFWHLLSLSVRLSMAFAASGATLFGRRLHSLTPCCPSERRLGLEQFQIAASRFLPKRTNCRLPRNWPIHPSALAPVSLPDGGFLVVAEKEGRTAAAPESYTDRRESFVIFGELDGVRGWTPPHGSLPLNPSISLIEISVSAGGFLFISAILCNEIISVSIFGGGANDFVRDKFVGRELKARIWAGPPPQSVVLLGICVRGRRFCGLTLRGARQVSE